MEDDKEACRPGASSPRETFNGYDLRGTNQEPLMVGNKEIQ